MASILFSVRCMVFPPPSIGNSINITRSPAGRPRNFLHGAAAAVWRRRAVLVDLEPHCAGRQRREAEHEGPRLGRVAERMPGNILSLAITSG